MNVVRAPWSAVLPWSIVGADDGDTAVVLPSVSLGLLTLAHRDGWVCHYPMPDGYATVLEPNLGEAVRNLLNAGFTLEMLDE